MKLATLTALALCAPALADVRYVDDDALPGGNGQAWASAYTSLADAVADQQATEIRVAAGKYLADGLPLRSGLAIIGGFGGETAVVGDIAGHTGFYAAGAENVQIARLTLANHHYGALHLTSTSIAIRDCRFIDSYSQFMAGAINAINCNIMMRGCEFSNNVTHDPGGSIYMLGGNLTAVGCNFAASISAGAGGGAAALYDGRYTIIGCRFMNCHGEGGGAIRASGNGLIALCEFSGNRSTMWGGAAVSFAGDSRVVIVGCDFRDNRTGPWSGGGIVQAEDTSRAALFGCRFSGNTEPLTLALEQAVIAVWP